jgi:iron(III) transport system permease protein
VVDTTKTLERGDQRKRLNLRALPEVSSGAITALILAVLILAPLVMIVFGAFRDKAPGFPNATWTLSNFSILGTPYFWNLFGHSLLIAVFTTVLSIVVGFVMAFIIAKVEIRRASLWDGLIMIPAYIAPFISSVAWSLLLAPKTGILNGWFSQIGIRLNIYSYPGIIFVMTLCFAPIVYLFVKPSIARLDRSLEESGRVYGGSLGYVIRRLIVPMMIPAIIASATAVFVLSMSDFGVPGVLGDPANINVMATQIVEDYQQAPYRPNEAALLGVALAVFTVAGMIFGNTMSRKRDYSQYAGFASQPLKINLGGWRWVAYLILVGYLVTAVVLPVGAVLIGSFEPYISTSLGDVAWTLDNYKFIFSDPNASRAVFNSILLSIGATVACAVLGVNISYMAHRGKRRWVRIVEYIANIPMSIPSTVIGLGLIWFWLPLHVGVYATMWIMFFAYIAIGLPYAVRPISASLLLNDEGQEDAARVMGGSWGYMMRRVVVPTLRGSIVAGSIAVFYHMLRELPASLLLVSPASVVLATLIWDRYVEGEYPTLLAAAAVIGVLTTVVIAVGNLLTRDKRGMVGRA